MKKKREEEIIINLVTGRNCDKTMAIIIIIWHLFLVCSTILLRPGSVNIVTHSHTITISLIAQAVINELCNHN